jgi:hypothetical protein
MSVVSLMVDTRGARPERTKRGMMKSAALTDLRIPLVCIIGSVLAACQPGGSVVDRANGESIVSQPESRDLSSQLLARKAKQDLAARLSIPVHSIELVKLEEVTWRDGSLGCPQRGMVYTQALVNGSLIVLRANGRVYEYHSGKGRDPFYCATPEPPLSPSDVTSPDV